MVRFESVESITEKFVGTPFTVRDAAETTERDSRSAPWSRLASNGHPGARLALAGGDEGFRPKAEVQTEPSQAKRDSWVGASVCRAGSGK